MSIKAFGINMKPNDTDIDRYELLVKDEQAHLAVIFKEEGRAPVYLTQEEIGILYLKLEEAINTARVVH